MNKTELWNNVVAILKKYPKLPKALKAELEELLAPKSGGGKALNPPIVDEKTGKTMYWCRYHQRYEVEDDMVMSGDKSKGYCKAAASKSNKMRKKAKELQDKVLKLMAEGKIEEATKAAKEAEKLKIDSTSLESFDYNKDWEEFRGGKTKTEEKTTKIEEKTTKTEEKTTKTEEKTTKTEEKTTKTEEKTTK